MRRRRSKEKLVEENEIEEARGMKCTIIISVFVFSDNFPHSLLKLNRQATTIMYFLLVSVVFFFFTFSLFVPKKWKEMEGLGL